VNPTPSLDEARLIDLALLASADPAHVRKAVRQAACSGSWTGLTGVGSPRALLLRDGDPLHTPMPGNPWGIPPMATLDEAITQVWGPVADDIPGFLWELRRRVLGMAHEAE